MTQALTYFQDSCIALDEMTLPELQSSILKIAMNVDYSTSGQRCRQMRQSINGPVKLARLAVANARPENRQEKKRMLRAELRKARKQRNEQKLKALAAGVGERVLPVSLMIDGEKVVDRKIFHLVSQIFQDF